MSKLNLVVMVFWGTTMGNDGLASADAFRGVTSGLSTPPGVSVSSQTIAKENAQAMTPDSQMNVAIALDNEAIARQKADELDGVLYEEHVSNEQRDKVDFQNSVILGYYPELKNTTGLDHTALGAHRQDLIEELESDRYYVVLMAYDFQSMYKQKQKKLLWVTRISIRARGNKFNKQLAAMTAYASKYFGQDSHGLLREALPEGRIEYGDLKTIGYGSGKPNGP